MPTRTRSRTTTWASLALVTTAAVPSLWPAEPASADRAPTPEYLARTTTLFGDRSPVATRSDPDASAVELGVRFRSAQPGWITGIRFFKTEGNTGTHTGTLWTEKGTALATGTFEDETGTGWQELVFDRPVRIDQGTAYIASYHAPRGHYVHDPGGLARGHANGPLSAPADGWGGANPVYRYGGSNSFPTDTWASANYWVDVRFQAAGWDPVTSTTTTTAPTTSTSRPPATTVTTRPTTTTGPTPTTARPPTTVTTRPPTDNPNPPAGVVLRPVDGGPDYFGRWANSLPTDPSFFPIAVWNETLDDPLGDTARYEAIGVNGYVGLWGGMNPQIAAALRASGHWAFTAPGPDGAPGYGREWAGYEWFDEPDGRDLCGDVGAWLRPLCTASGGRTTPESIAAMAARVRAVDPTRPTFGQYTKPVALGQGLDRAARKAYVDAVDVVSYDFYPLTDPWEPAGRALWDQADAVRNVRDLAGRSKPVWAFIETSRLFGDNPIGRVRPTDAQIEAEVWHAIIGGARGIEYFNHNFSGDPTYTQHLLIDPAYASTAAAVGRTNQRIHALAPVLNAPYADGVLTGVTGQVDTMVRYHDGAYWLFVGSRSKSAQTVSLRISTVANGTATVVDENRTVPVSGGVLTDTFSGETAVHIYRIG